MMLKFAATEPASPMNKSNKMKNHPATLKEKLVPALMDPDSPHYRKASKTTMASIKRQNMAGLMSDCTACRKDQVQLHHLRLNGGPINETINERGCADLDPELAHVEVFQ